MRWMLPVLVLALALGLLTPGLSAAQGPPPTPDPVAVAEAYTAAWNAHDLPAVLALFAPDAVVRERWGAVPPAVWDTRDPQVVRDYLEGAHDAHDGSRTGSTPGHLVWVTGHQEIAAWAALAFARRHRIAVGLPRAAGDTAGWPYREFADPYQLLPGVGPTEGDAEAVLRGGRITVLTLIVSPASVQRQWREADAAFVRVEATRHASPPGGEPISGPPRAAEPAPVGWPLALGGLALLAAVAAARRRRGGGTGAAERNRTTPGGSM